MTISQRYELGRSDGFADGYLAAQWAPASVHAELAEFPDRLRIARDGRQACAYFSAKYPERFLAARAFQAYEVGFARGYREGVQDYREERNLMDITQTAARVAEGHTARFSAKHLARAAAEESAALGFSAGVWLDSHGFIVSRMDKPVTRSDAALVIEATS